MANRYWVGAEQTNTYYFDGSDAAASDPGNIWTDETNVDDGSTSTKAYTFSSSSESSGYIKIEGTNAPSSGNTIRQVRARVFGSVGSDSLELYARIYTNGLSQTLGTPQNTTGSDDWGSYVTLSTPTGGWTWAKIQALETKIWFGYDAGVWVHKVEIEVTSRTGTGNWNDTSPTNWSATSGGSNNASVPTSSDDVYFDGNSGTGTCTLTADTNVANLNTTSFGGTITGTTKAITLNAASASLVLGSDIGAKIWGHASSTLSVTSNGYEVYTLEHGTSSSDGLTLNDDVHCTYRFYTEAGTFNANSHTITVDGAGGAEIRGGNLSSAVSGKIVLKGGPLYIEPGTYLDGLDIDMQATTTSLNFQLGSVGSGLGDIVLTSSGSYQVNFTQAINLIASSIEITAGSKVHFKNGQTYTADAWTMEGTSGNVITLESDSAGNAFTVDTNGATFEGDYLSIKDSTATDGTWYAGSNSTNVSGNTGWTFTNAPVLAVASTTVTYSQSADSTLTAGSSVASTTVTYSSSAIAVATVVGSWYNSSWKYRIAVTVDHTKIDSNLTSFPVYIDLDDFPDDFFSHVKTDGADMRATTGNGKTEIPLEVVSCNKTAKTGEVYVKLSVSSTTDTIFDIYYGNPSASAPSASSTYGANNVWSNCYRVYHMNSTTDSSGNQNATNHGGTSVTGGIGKAYDFDNSSSDYWEIEAVSAATDYSMEFYAKIDSNEADNRLTGCPTAPAGHEINTLGQYNSDGSMRIWNGSSWITWGQKVPSGSYYYFGYSIGSSGYITTWVGSTVGLDGYNSGHTSTYGLNMTDLAVFSKYDRYGTYTDGQLSEFRIWKTALSKDWTKAVNSNITSSSTFYSTSSEQSNGAAASATITLGESASILKTVFSTTSTSTTYSQTGNVTRNAGVGALSGITYSESCDGTIVQFVAASSAIIFSQSTDATRIKAATASSDILFSSLVSILRATLPTAEADITFSQSATGDVLFFLAATPSIVYGGSADAYIELFTATASFLEFSESASIMREQLVSGQSDINYGYETLFGFLLDGGVMETVSIVYAGTGHMVYSFAAVDGSAGGEYELASGCAPVSAFQRAESTFGSFTDAPVASSGTLETVDSKSTGEFTSLG